MLSLAISWVCLILQWLFWVIHQLYYRREVCVVASFGSFTQVYFQELCCENEVCSSAFSNLFTGSKAGSCLQWTAASAAVTSFCLCSYLLKGSWLYNWEQLKYRQLGSDEWNWFVKVVFNINGVCFFLFIKHCIVRLLL